jgi:RNA polymerase sigma-70 factor (ECF subfamily)
LSLSQSQFQRMVTDHGPSLYRMAYRMMGNAHDAEDIVQDAYRSAWKSRASFDEKRGERPWLAAILRRRAIDRWRGKPKPGQTPDGGPMEIAVPATDPLADQYTDEMQRALDQLSPELRECLLLVVVAELTHQEAADVLDIPLGTVLSRVSRARERLRKALLAAAG